MTTDAAIDDFSQVILIDPKNASAYHGRGFLKQMQQVPQDLQGACYDYKKAFALGFQNTVEYLQAESGAWCRNMR